MVLRLEKERGVGGVLLIAKNGAYAESMKKFYEWYWKKAKTKQGMETIGLFIFWPIVLFCGWCGLVVVSAVFSTELKSDEWALGGFLLSGLFLASISFWEGFPKPPKK